ncbi:NAD(P)H-quinone oxidoreductase [Luteitalea sp.]|uniref:NAD(P)H-quinone oxidoreductase n=1 Tax=Luteitalea sp. TaxID=2004800 RepID=UPI0025BE55B0|nr:NAD(P)H-quinone oxidoreductase [Luteitalea sp.]
MSLPALMDVVEIREPGGPDVLVAGHRPVPVPGPHEVLIAVRAAGVNRPDVFQRMGRYAPPPGASDLPGLEVAGDVVACGRDVVRWRVGDRVCALLAGGGYAAYAVAPEGQCLPQPAALSPVEAAAIPETFFTVWSNVVERGRLAPGETLLVHGGSSGIGTTAIQVAAHRGATVFATAGTPDKCAACEALGATRAVNYRNDDFVTVIREATGGRGVDVILDMVGGDYVARNLSLLAEDGRLVQIAVLQGAKATVDASLVMRRRLTFTGSTLRPRSLEEKARLAAALEHEVWPLLSAGTIRPQVFATWPLAQAAQAHAVMESSAHIGKLVLTV